MDYRKLLENSHKEIEAFQGDGELSRLEFLSEHIFDFTTYESEAAEMFAKKALEVCKAITDRKTFEYIEKDVNRVWFLLMCNMPFFASRIEWGTSIRGAWWEVDKLALSSCGLFDGDRQLIEPLKFTPDEWTEFIAAMIDFSERTA